MAAGKGIGPYALTSNFGRPVSRRRVFTVAGTVTMRPARLVPADVGIEQLRIGLDTLRRQFRDPAARMSRRSGSPSVRTALGRCRRPG